MTRTRAFFLWKHPVKRPKAGSVTVASAKHFPRTRYRGKLESLLVVDGDRQNRGSLDPTCLIFLLVSNLKSAEISLLGLDCWWFGAETGPASHLRTLQDKAAVQPPQTTTPTHCLVDVGRGAKIVNGWISTTQPQSQTMKAYPSSAVEASEVEHRRHWPSMICSSWEIHSLHTDPICFLLQTMGVSRTRCQPQKYTRKPEVWRHLQQKITPKPYGIYPFTPWNACPWLPHRACCNIACPLPHSTQPLQICLDLPAI